MFPSYRNQSVDPLYKLFDWFLYHRIIIRSLVQGLCYLGMCCRLDFFQEQLWILYLQLVLQELYFTSTQNNLMA